MSDNQKEFTKQDLKEAFNFYFMTGFPHMVDFDKWFNEIFSKNLKPDPIKNTTEEQPYQQPVCNCSKKSKSTSIYCDGNCQWKNLF